MLLMESRKTTLSGVESSQFWYILKKKQVQDLYFCKIWKFKVNYVVKRTQLVVV